jgi:hypothetical protein
VIAAFAIWLAIAVLLGLGIGRAIRIADDAMMEADQ